MTSVGFWLADPTTSLYRASAWLDCVVPTTWALVVKPLSDVPTSTRATTTKRPQMPSVRRGRRELAAAIFCVNPSVAVFRRRLGKPFSWFMTVCRLK